MLANGILDRLTFPASLAINAVVELGPSCFTSYVSSSFSSHMIAKLNDCSVKGMGRVKVGLGSSRRVQALGESASAKYSTVQ